MGVSVRKGSDNPIKTLRIDIPYLFQSRSGLEGSHYLQQKAISPGYFRVILSTCYHKLFFLREFFA